jgi:putative membrane protein
VYAEGDEPDYRFSFANERTFLAWIRTAIALLAAGVAIDAVDLSMSGKAQHFLTVLLSLSGMLAAAAAWIRWARAEGAMRRTAPLPAFGVGAIFALLVLVAGVVVVGAQM